MGSNGCFQFEGVLGTNLNLGMQPFQLIFSVWFDFSEFV